MKMMEGQMKKPSPPEVPLAGGGTDADVSVSGLTDEDASDDEHEQLMNTELASFKFRSIYYAPSLYPFQTRIVIEELSQVAGSHFTVFT
ncbi:hypothetical protein L2E82_20271 [Cichorium intybus]|uniref:Uncharacterized protein n=1 Tax=Cichorium intybus TaxID=13427 RepID=A0ACB9DSV4_CICIN|nr:hypothetical protein L2E82_20271 [Cichorium intybus]